jgi:hypothetical protein
MNDTPSLFLVAREGVGGWVRAFCLCKVFMMLFLSPHGCDLNENPIFPST